MNIIRQIRPNVLMRDDIDFNCIKCSNPVSVTINYNDSPMNDMFLSMAEDRLCMDCHCDAVVPKLAEVITWN